MQSFCRHLIHTTRDCDKIDKENHGNLENQKVALLKTWEQKKEQRTRKEFICPFTFLGYCVKAKELATDHFVYFSIKDDKEVLKRH